MGRLHCARCLSFICMMMAAFFGGGASTDAEPPGDYSSPFETVTIPLPNLSYCDVPLIMVRIPAGTFLMGAPEGERSASFIEKPQHQVTITEDFYLGMFEVTQAQWEAVMEEKPSFFGGQRNNPVELVSWDDCQRFVERLTAMGLGEFRLPTEAEWEYACRAGTTTRFSFGDALECSDTTCYFNCGLFSQYMWWCGNNPPHDEGVYFDYYGTKPVGLKLPNPWGLYDIHGNVWEWCSDWLGLYSAEPQVDPQGPAEGTQRVLRGGRWGAQPYQCRSAYRTSSFTDFRHISMGLRVVRSVQEPETIPPPPEDPVPLDTIIIELPNLPPGVKPLEMALIPAGSFEMGAQCMEVGKYTDEMPRHAVTITRPFYMGIYHVTQAHWEAVMGVNPASHQGDPDRPVEQVSWLDCAEFVDTLNTLGLGTFRLPTEAEWEYACRAGTTTRYSFGDALECPGRGAEFCDIMDQYMWWWGNNELGGALHGTKPVGMKLPNDWGLYGMHGNVWNWVSDWYGPYPADPQVDPQGPESGNLKIIRGGMWRSNARFCRSAFRDRIWPDFGHPNIGVRLVRETD